MHIYPISLLYVPSPCPIRGKYIIATVVYKEYSLIGKIGSFKLQISSSSLGALVYIILISFFLNIFLKGDISSFFLISLGKTRDKG